MGISWPYLECQPVEVKHSCAPVLCSHTVLALVVGLYKPLTISNTNLARGLVQRVQDGSPQSSQFQKVCGSPHQISLPNGSGIILSFRKRLSLRNPGDNCPLLFFSNQETPCNLDNGCVPQETSESEHRSNSLMDQNSVLLLQKVALPQLQSEAGHCPAQGCNSMQAAQPPLSQPPLQRCFCTLPPRASSADLTRVPQKQNCQTPSF